MSCPVEYWIWLQRTMGVGAYADELVSHFGDARDVYEAGEDAWIESRTLTVAEFKRLSSFSPSQSADVMSLCEKNGWHIVPYDSEYYPDSLRKINSFPLVLYVWGDVSILKSELPIGMVGTRNCSDYGLSVARALSGDLAGNGFTVVSGGAVGVDRACHEGAMDAGGKTIAFLGCGLGFDYLKSNENMRKRIAENGAVVSEFLPLTPASRSTFPIRNRLISGISLGTVVVEAKEKSGSLITARYSFNQGRPVFAVPGNVTNSNFFGTNKLIRRGAKPVISAYDIISEFAYIEPELENAASFDERINAFGADSKSAESVFSCDKESKPRRLKKKENNVQLEMNDICKNNNKNSDEEKTSELPADLPGELKKVYSYLESEPLHADMISQKSGIDVNDVLTALTELELYGLCSVYPGGRYSK